MRYIVVPIRPVDPVDAARPEPGPSLGSGFAADAWDPSVRRASIDLTATRPAPAPAPPAGAAQAPVRPVAEPPAPPPAPQPPPAPEPAASPEDALGHWVAAARASLDACLVVDAGGTVAGLSPTAAALLGTSPAGLVGRSLDDVLHLIDFTDRATEARGADRRIPPLIAVKENSLSRGMMRVRLPDGERRMLDAVAAPIHDDTQRPIGAVSFLASV